jgi:hypothetical protein
MVAITPAKQGQFFTPVPAIGQNVELSGHGQAQALKDLFGQGDFRLEASASFGSLGVIEPGPQGQDRLFIEERRQYPLAAEDISQVLGMILIPSARGDLLPRFLDNRVVQEKKDDGAGFNLKGMEEPMESRSQDLIHGPGIFPEKPGEAGERSGKERARQRLDHGGGVPFFPQLNEAHDEGRKDFERGA